MNWSRKRSGKYTKAFVDCGVKDANVEFTKNDSQMCAYGVQGVYDKIKNPNGVDIHHNVLQYLEEGAIDLVCLSSDLTMTQGEDRCAEIRSHVNLASDKWANCWHAAYKGLYGVDPAIDAADAATFTSITLPTPTHPDGSGACPASSNTATTTTSNTATTNSDNTATDNSNTATTNSNTDTTNSANTDGTSESNSPAESTGGNPNANGSNNSGASGANRNASTVLSKMSFVSLGAIALALFAW